MSVEDVLIESGPAAEAESGRRPWDLYTDRERWIFLIVLFLVGTSSYVDKNVIQVLLEPIRLEFHVSDTLLGFLSGFPFALFYAVLGVPVARLADRGNRVVVATVSLFVWSVMTALCGLAGSFWILVALRLGVGAGEAGAMPPAQSLLADYFRPEERARAIGIFVMSSSAGYVIGLMFGGFVAQNYGWRAAYLIVGLSGLALVPLTHFLLKEPRRLPVFAIRPEHHENVAAAFGALLGKAGYRNTLAAIVVYFLMSYGALVFFSTFLIRVHHLSVAQAGFYFGAVSALGALVGSVGGGMIADRLAARDLAWLGRFAGWGVMTAIPVFEVALFTSSLTVTIALLFVAATILCATVPSMFSAMHVVCGSRRRALATALAYFLANLIGLGLGPLITGMLSDHFALTYGKGDGLRLALVVMVPILVPVGWFMLRAARHLEADMED